VPAAVVLQLGVPLGDAEPLASSAEPEGLPVALAPDVPLRDGLAEDVLVHVPEAQSPTPRRSPRRRCSCPWPLGEPREQPITVAMPLGLPDALALGQLEGESLRKPVADSVAVGMAVPQAEAEARLRECEAARR
jgi:hypothetical protein